MRRRAAALAMLAGAVAIGIVAGVASQVLVVRVESGSMAPTISTGDIVVAQRSGGVLPARFDVVVFEDPGEWAADVARLTGVEAVPGTFVKRVIGLPGERVACCDSLGRITIDGAPLDEPYHADPDALASVLAFDVIVPDAAIFVLGDDRAASVDSRYLGSVPLQNLVAVERAVLRMP